MLNTHWALWKAILYFTEFSLALAATVESVVTDVQYIVHMFPQRSKGAHYFHRVVGL